MFLLLAARPAVVSDHSSRELMIFHWHFQAILDERYW
jgi:hypothetical protein